MSLCLATQSLSRTHVDCPGAHLTDVGFGLLCLFSQSLLQFSLRWNLKMVKMSLNKKKRMSRTTQVEMSSTPLRGVQNLWKRNIDQEALRTWVWRRLLRGKLKKTLVGASLLRVTVHGTRSSESKMPSWWQLRCNRESAETGQIHCFSWLETTH